jgi:hypothetical protein
MRTEPNASGNAQQDHAGRRRRLGPIAGTAILLSIAVAAASAIEPVAASDAQTRSAPASQPGAATNGAQPPAASPTGTYVESPAAFEFLTKGLGLPLGTSRTLTGARSGSMLTLVVGAPTMPGVALPKGVAPPHGATARLSIDTETNRETVVSSSATGALTVSIARASTTTLAGGRDVSGRVTDRLSLFGSTEHLSGAVTDAGGAAVASLAGRLASNVSLGSDVVVDGGTSLILHAGALAVSGSAALGRPGHVINAHVAGALSDTDDWTLEATSSRNASVLPGLTAPYPLRGTITDTSGVVRYDLRGVAGPWSLLPGLRIDSSRIELSDRLPSNGMFEAPGVIDGTDWAAVSGTVSAVSGDPTLGGPGAAELDLSTGAGLLSWDQSTALTLSSTPAHVVLGGASLTGHLRLTRTGLAGTVTGTGMVSVRPHGGKAVTADAEVNVTGSGQLLVRFPLDLSLLGLGPAGTVGTVRFAAGAAAGAVFGRAHTNQAAGPSVVNASGRAAAVSEGGSARAATVRSEVAGPDAAGPGASAPGLLGPGMAEPVLVHPLLARAPSAASSTSGSFTISSAVLALLHSLHIPLSSPSLSGTLAGNTLTVSLPAPTALPFTLPAGVPSPTFGRATVQVDLAKKTLSLHADGSAGSVSAELHVVVTNASTTTLTAKSDLTAMLALTGVPFFAGTTLALNGSISYTKGVATASLSGTLESDLAIASNVVLLKGALFSLAGDSGLELSGMVQIGSGNAALELDVAGSLKNLENWSLALSDPSAPMWQPVPSLTLTPLLSGSVTDAGGKVSFDVTTSNVNDSEALTWDAGAGATLSVTHLEVSNDKPRSGLDCPAGVADGDVWVDLQGTFGYTPADLDLTAEGCIDLPARAFTITTAATGTLLPGNPLFDITSASLTADGDIVKKTFTVTASAVLQVTALSNRPSFPVGASFGTDGVTVGAQLPDLSSLGFSGSGAIYVASRKVDNFDPTTLGGSGSPFDLPAGLSVTLDYSLPANVVAAFGRIGIDLGAQAQAGVHSVATLSTAGFSIDLGFSFGSGANGLKIVDTAGTGIFLNSFDLGLTVGAQSQVSISGSAYFEMPALVPGSVPSEVEVSVNGSFNFDSLTLNLGLSLSRWTNALGIDGLDIGSFAGKLGITFETGIPTPSLSFSADDIVLPSSWQNAIGMVAGAQISLDADINLDAPVISFSLSGPTAEQPALTPLALASKDATVVNSLLVNQASLVVAPFGGPTAAGDIVTPGISLVFDAAVDNVPAHIDATIGLVPPSLDADVSVGSFSAGPVNIDDPMLHLHIDPANTSNPIEIGFSGGVSSGNYSLSAAVSLALGNTANGASITLSVTAGLPSWLAVSGTLTGSISVGSGGTSVEASGSGYLTAGGSQLGPVSFSYDGSLSWSDVVDSFNQIATFFNNAGSQVSEIVQVLQSLGDSQQGVVNVLNAIGINPTAVLDAFTSVFGLINNNYDYIWVNPSLAQLYVLDVSGGSQSPNASVIDYSWNGGYNQQWAFVPGPDGDEIINRGSGQCLSVENDSTAAGAALVQYPCFGGSDQLWYIGSLSNYDHETITSASSGLDVDVAGASFFQGASIDQWPSNGGQNQYFWLSPGTN